MTRLNQSGLLFVPRHWQRASVIRWLKRVHAWTGFWGALLFLLLGASGFLLNHRTLLKIETGEPVELNRINIAVRPNQIDNPDALGIWTKRALSLRADAKPPPLTPPVKGERRFMGKPHVEVEQWTRVFNLPDGRVTVDYIPGSASVAIRRESVGLLSTIKNMHKGAGLGIAWILFIDTIAGALVAMSLTGFLLWTRLHGPRLLAGGIVMASLGWALFALVPALL